MLVRTLIDKPAHGIQDELVCHGGERHIHGSELMGCDEAGNVSGVLINQYSLWSSLASQDGTQPLMDPIKMKLLCQPKTVGSTIGSGLQFQTG